MCFHYIDKNSGIFYSHYKIVELFLFRSSLLDIERKRLDKQPHSRSIHERYVKFIDDFLRLYLLLYAYEYLYVCVTFYTRLYICER